MSLDKKQYQCFYIAAGAGSIGSVRSLVSAGTYLEQEMQIIKDTSTRRLVMLTRVLHCS
ncbi:MAG: hypothetical protein WKF89_08195 [Chitinophagaceae bacterium]